MIDATDKKILQILQVNARLSFREVAKKAQVSVVTVMHRVKALQEQRIITSYTILCDEEKLGYDIQAVINLRISKGKLFEVERSIAILPEVFALYDLTGEFDALIIAKFKSRKNLDAFLKRIQRFDFVERTQTSLVLNTIKEKPLALSDDRK